jgi:hypothetical protein
MNISKTVPFSPARTAGGKGKFCRNCQKIIPPQAGKKGHPIEITIEINRKIRKDHPREG